MRREKVVQSTITVKEMLELRAEAKAQNTTVSTLVRELIKRGVLLK